MYVLGYKFSRNEYLLLLTEGEDKEVGTQHCVSFECLVPMDRGIQWSVRM